jgi:hypothetical protein
VLPVPGSLLEDDLLSTTPSGEEWLMLAAASPWLIGTQIKMDVLKKEGYATWRASRLRSLSDIQSVRIVFAARLPEGGSEWQSGTVFVPMARRERKQSLSWVIFAKGTEFRRDFTPSRGKGAELPFIMALAALGYAVWVPDYSGMGDVQGVHEYCVAESLADSALDGLTAARQWLKKATTARGRAYAESGRLALIGYSEGGLTVMGTLKAIADERIPTPGLSLEAAYSMGAPLNLAIDVPLLRKAPFAINHPEYQVFIALGWARAYPGKFKLGDILSARTIDKIVPLANSRNEYDWIKKHSPSADMTFVRLGSKGHIVAGVEAFLFAIVDLDRREASLKAAKSP